ncbi:MAG: hypothetical protein WBL46_02855, partial [Nitrososphaeraceae archaeon]
QLPKRKIVLVQLPKRKIVLVQLPKRKIVLVQLPKRKIVLVQLPKRKTEYQYYGTRLNEVLMSISLTFFILELIISCE